MPRKLLARSLSPHYDAYTSTATPTGERREARRKCTNGTGASWRPGSNNQTKFDAVMADASQRGRAQIDSRADRRPTGETRAASSRVCFCGGARAARRCARHAPCAHPCASGAALTRRSRRPGFAPRQSTARSAASPAPRHDRVRACAMGAAIVASRRLRDHRGFRCSTSWGSAGVWCLVWGCGMGELV